MADFKIVEYEPSRAAGLADTGSRSGDSWDGYSVNFIPEVLGNEAART